MSYRTIEHQCVGCRTLLEASTAGAVECERCPHCGGIWIDTVAFVELLRATPTAQHVDELMVHNDGTARRACPHCAELMDIAWIDFLQLDQCGEHGVWLDPGELELALRSAAVAPPKLKLLHPAPRKYGLLGSW